MADPIRTYPNPDYSSRNYTSVKPGTLSDYTLGSLATYPADARRSWNTLSQDQRNTVLDYMSNYYGDYNAKAFVDSLQNPDASVVTLVAAGSSHANPVTLSNDGYRIATDRLNGYPGVQAWVRPDGKEVWVAPANIIQSGVLKADSNATAAAAPQVSNADPAVGDVSGLADQIADSQAKLTELATQLRASLGQPDYFQIYEKYDAEEARYMNLVSYTQDHINDLNDQVTGQGAQAFQDQVQRVDALTSGWLGNLESSIRDLPINPPGKSDITLDLDPSSPPAGSGPPDETPGKEDSDNGAGVDGGHTMLDPSGSSSPGELPADSTNPAFASADNTPDTLIDGTADTTLAIDSDSATIPLPGTNDPTAPPAIVGIALNTLAPLQSSGQEYTSAVIPLPGVDDSAVPAKIPDDGQAAPASFDPGQIPGSGLDSSLSSAGSSDNFLTSDPLPTGSFDNENLYGATSDPEAGSALSFKQASELIDEPTAAEPSFPLEPNRADANEFETSPSQPAFADEARDPTPLSSFPPPPTPASFEPEPSMSFSAPEPTISEPPPFEPAEPPMPSFTPSEPPGDLA